MTLHPDGPPHPDSGFFGLDDASGRIVILPVPFEATVSYGEGTADGPEAVRGASHQVDLCDPDVGDLREAGVTTDKSLLVARSWSDEARSHAIRAIEAQSRGEEPDPADLEVVNAASDKLEAAVFAAVGRLLDTPLPPIPIILGGDHSVPLGAFEAAAERYPDIGILQVDAHADLRRAYEGFHQSHASIMHNLLTACQHAPLTSVGLRDFSPEERDLMRSHSRIKTWLDRDLRNARIDGRYRETASRIVDSLPAHVWISWDIDGLDPALCPHTGTPVPGGLGWDEALILLETLSASGRTIVGCDLVEVAPGPLDPRGGDSWDAVVGARLLYKLAGYAMLTYRHTTHHA